MWHLILDGNMSYYFVKNHFTKCVMIKLERKSAKPLLVLVSHVMCLSYNLELLQISDNIISVTFLVIIMMNQLK